MEPIFDINKICRVCLEEGILLSIYSNEFAISPLDMIVSCTNVKITDDDEPELPSSICNNCMYRLEVAYQLKQQCENSDMRLRECLGLDLDNRNDNDKQDKLSVTIGKENYVKLVSIVPNNDSSTQVKDEEIYAAMNAMCEIFGENGNTDTALLQSQIEQNVIPNNSVSEQISHVSYIDHSNIETSLNLAQVNLVLDSNSQMDETGQGESHIENKQALKMVEKLGKSTKKRKQMGIVSREDLDKLLKEKKNKRKIDKTETRKTKKLTDPEQCLHCGKTFAYGYMESHVRIHSGEKPFKCSCCNLKFAQPGNLALHMRVHSGEKPYQCEKCSKLFTTSSNLKAHLRIHSDSRDFKCTQCDRAFKSSSELASHAGTHSGEKRHRCSECGKTFYKTSYLTVHYRTVHIGEKRHRCSECGKKFSNSSNLTCHYRIHSGEKPFSCNFCDARFNQSSALVRHSKQHTSNSLKTDIKSVIAEPTSKVMSSVNNVIYETSIECQSMDPFTTYLKIPDASNLIDSNTIMDISKSHTAYSFDVQNI